MTLRFVATTSHSPMEVRENYYGFCFKMPRSPRCHDAIWVIVDRMTDKCNFYMIFIILLFIKIVSFPLFLLI